MSSFAGAFVDDAMVGIYSPSAVAFNGGVQRDSFAVAFETPVVNGDQHGAVTGSQFVDMTDLESRPFMPVSGLVANEAVKEWRSGVTAIDAGNSPPSSVWQGGTVLAPLVRVGEIEAGAGKEPEEEVDPHEDISQVAKFLQGQEAGSHRSRELHADVRRQRSCGIGLPPVMRTGSMRRGSLASCALQRVRTRAYSSSPGRGGASVQRRGVQLFATNGSWQRTRVASTVVDLRIRRRRSWSRGACCGRSTFRGSVTLGRQQRVVWRL